jgi:hypothetical protein
MTYPILHIDPACVLDDEQLGSKAKFWFERNKQRWLFKEARIISSPAGEIVTGEDWAEKVAAEIAVCIGIDAAKVELAEFQGKRGSASLSFITDRAYHLEHGNEVLAGRVFGYDQTKKQKQSAHTMENIVGAIQRMFPQPTHSQYVLERLAGYLVFDALIGNTDRHHENWGLFWRTVRKDDPIDDWDQPITARLYKVAPTFDHASSLGRELLDEKRARLLKENSVGDYVRKGHGGIYWRTTDRKGANPLELVESAVRLPSYREYFRPALSKLRTVALPDLQATLNGIPAGRISDCGKEFAKVMLDVAYSSLTGLLK